jgi:hypothetical protein
MSTLTSALVATEEAVSNKSPGLDGLSYEFYHATLPLVGPLTSLPLMQCFSVTSFLSPFAVALSTSSPLSLLHPSFTPLLCCLLITIVNQMLAPPKIFAKRPPSHSAVLCEDSSIFDGAATVLLAAEYLHLCGVPGFLLSLDFFHVYDRVSVQWLDCVLEAMDFGVVLRHWVATLHFQASASFMLHTLSPDMAVEFSIHQDDPADSVFFVIYIEPFLVRLEVLLCGLFMCGIIEASFGYMDDVNVLGVDEEDIITVDGWMGCAGLLRSPPGPSLTQTARL